MWQNFKRPREWEGDLDTKVMEVNDFPVPRWGFKSKMTTVVLVLSGS